VQAARIPPDTVCRPAKSSAAVLKASNLPAGIGAAPCPIHPLNGQAAESTKPASVVLGISKAGLLDSSMAEAARATAPGRSGLSGEAQWNGAGAGCGENTATDGGGWGVTKRLPLVLPPGACSGGWPAAAQTRRWLVSLFVNMGTNVHLGLTGLNAGCEGVDHVLHRPEWAFPHRWAGQHRLVAHDRILDLSGERGFYASGEPTDPWVGPLHARLAQ